MKRVGVIGLGIVLVSLVTLACEREATEEHARQEQPLDIVGCTHAICATGEALVAACDPCATTLCAADPYCCSDAWDATCVGEVASICGKTCSAPPPADAGTSTCGHPVCAVGAALTTGCDACATQLCAQDPYCCAAEWDATCVTEVASICKQSCL